jgi:hypothetical protein
VHNDSNQTRDQNLQDALDGSTDKVLQRFAPVLYSRINQYRAMYKANGHLSTTAENADQYLTPEAKDYLVSARGNLARQVIPRGVQRHELVNKLKLKLESEGRGRTEADQRKQAKWAKPLIMFEYDRAHVDGRRGKLKQVTATQQTIEELKLEEHYPGLVVSNKCFGRLGKAASQEGTDCVVDYMWTRHREYLPLNTSPEELQHLWGEGLQNALNPASTASDVYPVDTKHSRCKWKGCPFANKYVWMFAENWKPPRGTGPLQRSWQKMYPPKTNT